MDSVKHIFVQSKVISIRLNISLKLNGPLIVQINDSTL